MEDFRHPLANSAAAIGWLLVGVAAVVASVWLLAVETPERAGRDHALKSAAACPSPPRTAPADCLWAQEFTVSDVHLQKGRGDRTRATLTSPETGPWRTEYRNEGPLLEQLRDGDRVVGTIWRGNVVKIAAHDTEQVTDASPTDLAEASLGLATALGPSGLLLTVACGWRWLRRADREPTRPMRALVRLAAALAVAALPPGIAVTLLKAPLWLIPGTWLPLAALCTWCAVDYARRPPKPAPLPRLGVPL
ncbi:hypothetical protein [Streptomyces sp. NPDC002537]